jgi:uncharacterized OB-fold protein
VVSGTINYISTDGDASTSGYVVSGTINYISSDGDACRLTGYVFYKKEVHYYIVAVVVFRCFKINF